MTLIEAKTAMRNRLRVQICGATAAKLYGKVKYQRIQRVNLQYDKQGEPYYTAELVNSINSILTCGIEDVELADDLSERVRAEFERVTTTEENK